MTDNFSAGSIQSHEHEASRLLSFARIAYGVLYGFAFALLVWGYDGRLLAASAAEQPWTKLLFGLPLAVIVGFFAGRLTARYSSMGASIVIWMSAHGLLGIIAGRIPFAGRNLAGWLADQRLWGVDIYPYERAALVRTILVVLINIALGVVVGVIEDRAVERAWDRTTPDDKMSWQSWLALLSICVPLALLPTATIDGFVNRPLRISQQVVGELVGLTVAGASKETIEAKGSSYRSIEPFREALSERYVNHFVTFGSDTETWYSAYVDIAFADGLVLRCVSSGNTVLYCDDFSTKFAAWMEDLIRAGLYGERGWLDDKMKRLVVDDAVIDWLAAHGDQLSENYEVSRDGQQGGWILMSARFDTGLEMLCRFHGATPIQVDQCEIKK
jgi:hypothetical protein